jgi:GAF domain-containing protein
MTTAEQSGHPSEAELPQLAQTLVKVADALVDDYDVVDLLHHLVDSCMQLLGASEAGILLTDQRGDLQVVATSSESSRLLEVFQRQRAEGPCMDAMRQGEPVSSPDLRDEDRWPPFVEFALDAGIMAVDAVPMRLRGTSLGGLNLFHREVGGLTAADLRLAQALADLATVGVLHQRNSMLAEQLQSALNSRIVIEQAKGIIAERHQVDFDTAFARLRKYARDHNLRLSDAALWVVRRQIDLKDLQT